MSIQSIELVWIVVKDLKQSLEYYTKILGLQVMQYSEAYGWAELCGCEGGMRLGLAQSSPREPVQPGTNGVITMTVQDMDMAKASFAAQGVKFRGDILEIPGEVKLQSCYDPDGNHFQIVQKLRVQ